MCQIFSHLSFCHFDKKKDRRHSQLKLGLKVKKIKFYSVVVISGKLLKHVVAHFVKCPVSGKPEQAKIVSKTDSRESGNVFLSWLSGE